MFKRNSTTGQLAAPPAVQAVERITSVLGPGVIWEGKITGSGGVRIEGTSIEGEDVHKTVMLPLNTQGTGPQRIKNAGLSIMATGGEVQVMAVKLRSPAARAGFEQGFKVTGVEVAADRMPKEWLYIPALLLLGLIFLLQRLRPQSAPTRTAAAT